MTQLTFQYQAAPDQMGFSASTLRANNIIHAELRDDSQASVDADIELPTMVRIHLRLDEVEAAYRNKLLMGAKVTLVGFHNGHTLEAVIDKVRLDPRNRKIYSLDMSVHHPKTIEQ